MKKHGFTLAELLIVLGIAGVVAAVILPAINGLMPDKTKINYLKVYDELGKNIKALTSDSSIFPVLLKEGSTDIDVSRYPLVNNSQPLKAPFNDDTKYSGDNKLCNLLAHTFGADSCSTTSYPDNSSFTTPNGMEWWISQTKREVDTAENKISYQTDIYVDVDSSKKSSNCMYGEDGCKNPDRFKFLLAADGRLVPADPVGVHYINTRKNLLKKKFEAEGEVLAQLDDDLLNNDYNLFDDKEDNVDNNNSNSSSGDTTDPGTPEGSGELQPAFWGTPCAAYFRSDLGTLRMRCFHNAPAMSRSICDNFGGIRAQNDGGRPDNKSSVSDYIKRIISGSSFHPSIGGAYFFDLYATDHRPTTDIKLYYDVFYICTFSNPPKLYYPPQLTCYVNDKYRNKFTTALSAIKEQVNREYGQNMGICSSHYKYEPSVTYVSEWQDHVAVSTLEKDKDHIPMGGLSFLYNPFEQVQLDNISDIIFSSLYSDVQPRYDGHNVYMIVEGKDSDELYNKQTNGYPRVEDVAAWVLNKDFSEVVGSDFVKNSKFGYSFDD